MGEDDLEQDEQGNLTEEETAEADAAEDETIQQERRAQAIADFHQMRALYRPRSAFWPFLSYDQLKKWNAVKKYSPGEYAAFRQLVAMRTSSFWAKFNSALAAIVPILPIVLIGLLIIVAIVAIIGIIMPWLVGDADETAGMSSPFGVFGDKFYGARAIYKDDAQAQKDMLADYAGALNYVVQDFNSANTTIKILLTLPYENGVLNLNKLQTEKEYAEELSMVKSAAEIVFLADNAGSGAVLPTDLNQILDGIKYFGIDAQMANSIATAWAQYIIDSADSSTPVYQTFGGEDGEEVQVEQTTFETPFAAALNAEFAGSAPSRTQKLYVQDYILPDKDSYVESLPQRQYVAYVFMAKTQVDMQRFSFLVRGVEEQDCTISLLLNGKTHELTSRVFSAKGELEENFATYLYELDISAQIAPCTEIDTNNLNALKNAASLYNILRNKNLNSSLYLQADASNNVYTFKTSNATALFNTNAPFYVAEYETDYQDKIEQTEQID